MNLAVVALEAKANARKHRRRQTGLRHSRGVAAVEIGTETIALFKVDGAIFSRFGQRFAV